MLSSEEKKYLAQSFRKAIPKIRDIIEKCPELGTYAYLLKSKEKSTSSIRFLTVKHMEEVLKNFDGVGNIAVNVHDKKIYCVWLLPVPFEKLLQPYEFLGSYYEVSRLSESDLGKYIKGIWETEMENNYFFLDY